MTKGYMYILLCNNGSYYTGSTKNLEKRMAEHEAGEGAVYTRKYRPIQLVYFETFDRIDLAFYREKQIQKWSHKKKKALIEGHLAELQQRAECQNESHSKNRGLDSARPPKNDSAEPTKT